MVGKPMLLWLTITVIQYLTSVSAFIIPQTKNTTYLFTDSPNYRNRSRLFSNENPDYPGSELVFNKRYHVINSDSYSIQEPQISLSKMD